MWEDVTLSKVVGFCNGIIYSGMMMGLGKRSDAWSSQNYYGDEFY